MDTFENSGYEHQEEANTQPSSQTPYETSWQNTSGSSQPFPPRTSPEIPKKSSGKGWKTALAAVLAVVLVAGSCGATAVMVNSHWEAETSRMTTDFTEKINDLQNQLDRRPAGNVDMTDSTIVPVSGMTPGQVYAQNVEGVVAISNHATSTNIFGQVSETASAGSGFIISEDGYVVSNYHVVKGATKLTVLTVDGKEHDAKVVGFDAGNDVALLKIEAENLHPVTIGSSDALSVGDQVAAIGNPLGELTSSLTVGYVSAKDRTVNTDGTNLNMIQIDAAINPGNSGGPLFNMRGEVIGINTAKYSGQAIEGIGFAIPIDEAMSIVSDLKEYGYVNSAYLGVSVVNVDAETSSLYGLPRGSLVMGVTEGSCAEEAGLQKQDIIVGIGEYPVETNTDLTKALRRFKAGDETVLKIYRAGREMELSITLDEKPAPVDPQLPADPERELPSNGSYDEWYEYFAPFFGGR